MQAEAVAALGEQVGFDRALRALCRGDPVEAVSTGTVSSSKAATRKLGGVAALRWSTGDRVAIKSAGALAPEQRIARPDMPSRLESSDRVDQAEEGGARRQAVGLVDRLVDRLVEGNAEIGGEVATRREAEDAEARRIDAEITPLATGSGASPVAHPGAARASGSATPRPEDGRSRRRRWCALH